MVLESVIFVVFRRRLHEMSEVFSTATLFADVLRAKPCLLLYLVGYGCQSLALVHTTTEHTRDWCIGLLTFFCQSSMHKPSQTHSVGAVAF